MNTTITPLDFLAGSESLGASLEGWSLDEAPHGAPARTFRHHVEFNRAFAAAPLVHLGLAGFDVSNADSARVATRAEGVTASGFDIVVTTWLHSRLWRVDVNWLAVGGAS
jgi:hypothetical protein